MLIETGRVVAVEANEEALWVETIRQSTCGSCAANKGCGHGLLNRANPILHSCLALPPLLLVNTASIVKNLLGR